VHLGVLSLAWMPLLLLLHQHQLVRSEAFQQLAAMTDKTVSLYSRGALSCTRARSSQAATNGSLRRPAIHGLFTRVPVALHMCQMGLVHHVYDGMPGDHSRCLEEVYLEYTPTHRHKHHAQKLNHAWIHGPWEHGCSKGAWAPRPPPCREISRHAVDQMQPMDHLFAPTRACASVCPRGAAQRTISREASRCPCSSWQFGPSSTKPPAEPCAEAKAEQHPAGELPLPRSWWDFRAKRGKCRRPKDPAASRRIRTPGHARQTSARAPSATESRTSTCAFQVKAQRSGWFTIR